MILAELEDECHWDEAFARSRQRAYGTRPQQRGRNISLIGAIALRGIVASIAIVGAVDGLTFEALYCPAISTQPLAGSLRGHGQCLHSSRSRVTPHPRTCRSDSTLSLCLFP